MGRSIPYYVVMIVFDTMNCSSFPSTTRETGNWKAENGKIVGPWWCCKNMSLTSPNAIFPWEFLVHERIMQNLFKPSWIECYLLYIVGSIQNNLQTLVLHRQLSFFLGLITSRSFIFVKLPTNCSPGQNNYLLLWTSNFFWFGLSHPINIKSYIRSFGYSKFLEHYLKHVNILFHYF